MRLRRPLPPGRTFDQIRSHYLVEKAIADRLRSASRDERSAIYATMYDELFRMVPDHPRLAQRASDELTSVANAAKLRLLEPFLDESTVFVEFGCGDCRLAMEIARRVKRAYAVDISDQRAAGTDSPASFTLIVYDGYALDGIPEGSVDLAFSYNLLEHLHPDDARHHFAIVHRLLKPGGRYVFHTPHAFTGPHDISVFFSDEPEGFHLKEWTFLEIRDLLREANQAYARGRGYVRAAKVWVPDLYYAVIERALRPVPARYRRRLARWSVPQITVVAVK